MMAAPVTFEEKATCIWTAMNPPELTPLTVKLASVV
jgi:hypothetical protein